MPFNCILLFRSFVRSALHARLFVVNPQHIKYYYSGSRDLDELTKGAKFVVDEAKGFVLPGYLIIAFILLFVSHIHCSRRIKLLHKHLITLKVASDKISSSKESPMHVRTC